MPLARASSACWVLLVYSECSGEWTDHHLPASDPTALRRFEAVRWHLFAADPMSYPPRPTLDAPCLLVRCPGCGRHVGDGEHFVDAEHAWEAAEQDGWQGDVCPFCQPSSEVVYP